MAVLGNIALADCGLHGRLATTPVVQRLDASKCVVLCLAHYLLRRPHHRNGELVVSGRVVLCTDGPDAQERRGSRRNGRWHRNSARKQRSTNRTLRRDGRRRPWNRGRPRRATSAGDRRGSHLDGHGSGVLHSRDP
jgi:hypothetical protein